MQQKSNHLVRSGEDTNMDLNSTDAWLDQAILDSLVNMSMDDFISVYNLSESALCVLSGECKQRFNLPTSSILALVLGFTAMCLNLSSLLAISQIRSRINTHFRYIASLAVSDILIGVSLTLHIINSTFNPAPPLGRGSNDARLKSRCLFAIIKALHSMGLIVSLLNLTGMAIDHYIAILKPLHHQRLMSNTRGIILIVSSWVLAFLFGFSDFFAEPDKIPLIIANHSVNYCEAIYITRYQEEYCLFATAVITLSSMTYIYIRIYTKIRSHSKPGFSLNSSQSNNSKRMMAQMVLKNKRALITTLFILGTFILCWMPNCLFEVTLIAYIKLHPSSLEEMRYLLVKVNRHLYNLLIVNSILDPIIYAIRIREIRLGYKRLIFRSHCWKGIGRDQSTSSLCKMEAQTMDTQMTGDVMRCGRKSSTFTKLVSKF